MDEDISFADHNWERRAGGKMLLYFGPHRNETFERDVIRRFTRAKRAWGAFWNYDWNRDDGPWYAYVCDTPGYDIDKIQSKNSRKTIRRSLERCQTRRVDPAWLAEHGYPTYHAAVARYTNYRVQNEEEFVAETRALEAVPGIIMHGVFVDEALAAYGIAYEVGDAVRFREAFFDPAYSQAKPMYALYYALAYECLNDRFQHIDAGWRPLVHDTNIEEFFRRMGWRQAPCRIGLYLNYRLRAILFMARMFRRPLKALLPSRHWLGLEALLVADDAERRSAP